MMTTITDISIGESWNNKRVPVISMTSQGFFGENYET